MKIDAFNHIITPKYNEARLKAAQGPALTQLQAMQRAMPTLFDLDARFRAMDVAGSRYVQVLNAANPPVETFASPQQALELSRIANDEMAELVRRYPDRFIGATACLPMNDVNAAIE